MRQISRCVTWMAAVLIAGSLSGCAVDLQHDLAEDDANDIYVLLIHNGIESKKLLDASGNEPKYTISVSKSDVGSAAQLLREYSLPRPKSQGLAAFRMGKGMIPTQTEEKAMYQEALQGEVSNSLNRIPGVLEARIIINQPEVNDLTQPEKKPATTASVLIKYRNLSDPKASNSPVSESDVQQFVANAVPELKKDNVKVVLVQAPLPESEKGSGGMMQSVLGMNMDKSSANQFKVIVVLAALLMVLMAVFTAWAFMKGGTPQANGNRRSRTPPG